MGGGAFEDRDDIKRASYPRWRGTLPPGGRDAPASSRVATVPGCAKYVEHRQPCDRVFAILLGSSSYLLAGQPAPSTTSTKYPSSFRSSAEIVTSSLISARFCRRRCRTDVRCEHRCPLAACQLNRHLKVRPRTPHLPLSRRMRAGHKLCLRMAVESIAGPWGAARTPGGSPRASRTGSPCGGTV